MFEKYHSLLSKSPIGGVPCLIPETNIAISHLPPPQSHPRVVDLGSGQGSWSDKLKNLGYQVTSLDLDPSQYGATIKAEMHEFPLENNSQDIVLCTGTFEHAYAPFVVLHEMRRVLRDGGVIAITLPAADNIKMLEDEAHWSIFSKLQLEHMFFKKLDMEIIHYEIGEWDSVVGVHQVFIVRVNKSRPNKYDLS